MGELKVGDKVKVLLTGEIGMIVGIVKADNEMYIIRMPNYSEVAFRRFELEIL